MNRQRTAANLMSMIIGLLVLGVLLCAGTSALTGYTISLDGSGLHLNNPQAEANARKIEAETQALQNRSNLDLDTEAQAQPAAVTSKIILYIGASIAGVVALLGVAFGFALWVNKKASAVYADSKGMYPIITRRGFGWVTFHDPNRQLSSAAVYRTPTALDVAAGAVRFLMTGKAPGLPELATDFPATASEQSMLQVASQAQAVGLMAAVTRPQGLMAPAGKRGDDLDMARQVLGALDNRPAMPQVTIVNDPEKIADFQRLLEAEG